MSRPTNEPVSELIRAEDLLGVDVWALPSFDPEPPAPEPVPVIIEEIEEVPLDEVQPLTLEELESIRQEAYNEGFAVGEREGFHSTQIKVRQEAEIALEARMATLQQLMVHLFLPIAEQDAQIEKSMVELVGHIARQVIQRELTIDSSQIETVLRESLKLLPMGANNVRIFVNPQDFVQVKALRERHEETWRILEDPALLPGGCRVETEHSRIDATIETRITQAIAMMFGQLHEQGMHPAEADMDIDLAAMEAQHLQDQAQARAAAAQARQAGVAEPSFEPAVDAAQHDVQADADAADSDIDAELNADLAKLEAELGAEADADADTDVDVDVDPDAEAATPTSSKPPSAVKPAPAEPHDAS